MQRGRWERWGDRSLAEIAESGKELVRVRAVSAGMRESHRQVGDVEPIAETR